MPSQVRIFSMTHKVILFYKYITIENPEEFRISQKKLCEDLGLKGRIIIAEEGINGTLEGKSSLVEEYVEEMRRDRRFADIDFKESAGNGNVFPKLSIKVRPEIVASGLGQKINPAEKTANRLEPENLHDWFESKKDFVVVDMRNDYEFRSGRFKNSVEPGMKNFRDLKQKVKAIEDLKDKTVVTVCTGGVRCEKASAFLEEQGFKEVYQLNGGIHRYIEKYPDGYFEGGLYVFDGRVVMDAANSEKRSVIGSCVFCSEKTEDYYNDETVEQSEQVLVCEKCVTEKDFLRPAKRAAQVKN